MITAQRAVSGGAAAAINPGEDDITAAIRTLPLMSVMPQLPRLQRQVLILRMQEIKPIDIARHIGCAEMQVSRLLRGAATNLRALLDRELAQDSEPWA